MEKREKNIFLILGFIFVIVISIGINVYASLTDMDITIEDNVKLIVSIITFTGIILTLIFSSKGASKDDVVKLGTEVKEVKLNVKELYQRYDDIAEVMSTMQDDIKESDKKLFFVSESIMHREQIINLAKKIESQTVKILEDIYDIDQKFKDFIVNLTSDIAGIIKNQYDYGFNDFDTVTFKRKLIKQAELNLEYVKELDLNQIFQSIVANICNYIKEVDLIKNTNNGIRRIKFEELTLKMTKKITFHSIQIIQKQLTK